MKVKFKSNLQRQIDRQNKSDRCPICNHQSLRPVNYTQVVSIDHENQHVKNRIYSGQECQICSWTNKGYVIK
jgi:uncharacterized protein with PIN domain